MKIKYNVLNICAVGLMVVLTGCGATKNLTEDQRSTISNREALQKISNQTMKGPTQPEKEKPATSSGTQFSLSQSSDTRETITIKEQDYYIPQDCRENKKSININDTEYYSKVYIGVDSQYTYIEYFDSVSCKNPIYKEFIHDDSEIRTKTIEDINGDVLSKYRETEDKNNKKMTITQKGVYENATYKTNDNISVTQYYSDKNFDNTPDVVVLTGTLTVTYTKPSAKISMTNINLNLKVNDTFSTINKQDFPFEITIPFDDGKRTFNGNFKFTSDTEPSSTGEVTTINELVESSENNKDETENFWSDLYDEDGNKVANLIVRFDDQEQLEIRMYNEEGTLENEILKTSDE